MFKAIEWLTASRDHEPFCFPLADVKLMLIFDELFASGEPVPRGQDRDNVILGCVLWADDAGKRVRFYISPGIIDGVLKGENSVHDHQNVELCVRERTRLEEACQRAFDRRPGHYVELEPHDFR